MPCPRRPPPPVKAPTLLKPETLNGRKVVGLVRDGHAFAVSLDAKLNVETPAFAFIVPVASYKEFRGWVKPDGRKTIKAEAGYDSFLIDNEPSSAWTATAARDPAHDQGSRRDLRQEPRQAWTAS